MIARTGRTAPLDPHPEARIYGDGPGEYVGGAFKYDGGGRTMDRQTTLAFDNVIFDHCSALSVRQSSLASGPNSCKSASNDLAWTGPRRRPIHRRQGRSHPRGRRVGRDQVDDAVRAVLSKSRWKLGRRSFRVQHLA